MEPDRELTKEEFKKLLKGYKTKTVNELLKWYRESLTFLTLALENNGKDFDKDGKEVTSFVKKSLKYLNAPTGLCTDLDNDITHGIFAGPDVEECFFTLTLKDFNFKEGVTEELLIDIRHSFLAMVYAVAIVLYKNIIDSDIVIKSIPRFAEIVLEEIGLIHFLKEESLGGDEAEEYKEFLISWLVGVPMRLGVQFVDQFQNYTPKVYPIIILPGEKDDEPGIMIYFTSTEKAIRKRQ